MLGLAALASPAFGDEQPQVKQSEITKKAHSAADEVIQAAKKAAEEEGYDLPEKNIIELRRRLVEAYIQDIRAAGYNVYDP